MDKYINIFFLVFYGLSSIELNWNYVSIAYKEWFF